MALLHVARAVAADDVELVLFDALAEVPAFNPDTDPTPAVVNEFRALVQSADGLIFATPEYAHGLPGSLKNVLDWLVGSSSLSAWLFRRAFGPSWRVSSVWNCGGAFPPGGAFSVGLFERSFAN